MRYNVNPYNRSPYNRAFGQEFKCSATLLGTANIGASSGLLLLGASKLSANSELDNIAIRELSAAAKNMSGGAELLAQPPGVETVFGAIINAGASLLATASIDYTAKTLSIVGFASTDMQGGIEFGSRSAIESSGTLEVNGSVESPRGASMSGDGMLDVSGGLVERFAIASMSGSGTIKPSVARMDYGGESLIEGSAGLAGIGRMDQYPKTAIQAGATLQVAGRLDYAAGATLHGGAKLLGAFEAVVQETLLFTGTLPPNGILIINTCNFTATMDGVNVLEQIEAALEKWIRLNSGSIRLEADVDGFSELGVKVESSPRYS